MTLQYQIRIYGKVQGVFFRANTFRVATDLGITGWVRNEMDGSVQIVAEGERTQLDRLLSWCNKGPAYCQVNKIECKEGPVRNYKTFEIIRN